MDSRATRKDDESKQGRRLNRRPLIAVYLMASQPYGTLYTGVTSNLYVRVDQHREGRIEGFTKRYGCKRLVWWEPYFDMVSAIVREKAIKHWGRQRKIALIEKDNPRWQDLYQDLTGAPLDLRAFNRLAADAAAQPSPHSNPEAP